MSGGIGGPSKKKTKQVLYREKPNDEALYCDICEGWVHCSSGGQGNLRNHESSKLHKENYEKKHPTPRRGPLDKFWTKKTAGTSNAQPPAPLTNIPSDLSNSTDVASAPALDFPVPDPAMVLSPDALLSLSAIQRLRNGLLSLPSDIRIARSDDPLSVFAFPCGNPEYDDQLEYAGKVLHSAFSYGMSQDELRALVSRGQYGLDGFCTWLEYFVRHYSLGSGVVEAKVTALLTAIESLGGSAAHPPNDPIDVQSDMPIDLTVGSSPPARARSPSAAAPAVTLPCPGLRVNVLNGQSAHTAYPFALHFYLSLPWTYRSVGDDVILHADSCTHQCASFSTSTACDSCAALGGNEILVNIFHRIQHGAAPHTAYEYLSHEQLVQLLRRKNSVLEELRFNLLSAGRVLTTLTTANDRSQRIMRFIAEGKIQRAGAVLSNAFKRGYGLVGVMNLLSKAAEGLYRAKSYTELEFRKAVVLLRFGGGRTSEFGYRALGLPSPRTIRRHMPSAVLEASPGMPAVAELSRNIATALDSDSQPLSATCCGYVLMLDEIAVEKRLRWDPKTNMILGTCREHNSACALEFRTDSEARMLFKAIDSGKVHLASEATVMAIGPLAREPRLYEARPFGISGTCKREIASAQEILIRNGLSACNLRRGSLGRCYCIASDGDARRRLALASITMHSRLSSSSPIYSQLASLPLMNLWCGEDDITPDIDFKHIAKRFRNTLLRACGTTVNGVLITRAVLHSHLVDSGLSADTVNALLNPDDHQDVTLMYRLLAAIVNLPESPSTADPFSNEARRVLWLLGQAYYYLLSAYTDTSLSLRTQLEYLAATAFLVMQLYRQDQQRFIPSQLYIDLMIMIKNVYFCVAKTKVDDPKGSFWLLLLGTDRLEVDFGYSRTMIGNDSNCDLYELSTRFLAIVQLALILAEHPEWDRGPRRLRLPPNVLSIPVTELDNSIDHLNPASWKGDVRVADVVLLTCWNHGRELAEAALAAANVPASLDEMCAGAGYDIFCPFGGNNSVLLDCGPDSVDDSIVVESTPVAPEPTPAASGDPAGDLEEDLTTEIAEAAYESQESSYSPTVLVDGVSCHKGRFLRLWSESHGQAGSTDRLDRIIGQSRFHSHRVGSAPPAVDEATLEIDDPVSTLLRCDNNPFLALARVVGIRIAGNFASSVPLSALREPGVRVTVQILHIEPRDGEKDWIWAGKWETRRSQLHLDGRHVQVISPTTDIVDGTLSYLFSTEELRLLTGELYGRLRGDLHHLPELSSSKTFPYQTARGSACFIAQSEDPDADIERCRYRCSRCPAALLDETDMRLIREHMGAHVQHDPQFSSIGDICGLCLRTGGKCTMILKKGTAKDSLILDMEHSHCPNLFKRFSLKPAGETKQYSPCSNVPVRCPVCDPKKSPAAVWRYNMRTHLLEVHELSEQGIDKYRSLWFISDDERKNMKKVYALRGRKQTKRKAHRGKRKLQISAAHSSRFIERTSALTLLEELPQNDQRDSLPPAAKKQRIGDGSARPTQRDASAEGSGSESSDSADDWDSDSERDDDAFTVHSDSDDDPPSMQNDGDSLLGSEGRNAIALSAATASSSVPATAAALSQNAAQIPQPSQQNSTPLHPNPPSTSQRPARSRLTKTTLISAGICFCDSPARGEEVHCTKKGCETVVFHRSCVDLAPDEPVPRWKCPVCVRVK